MLRRVTIGDLSGVTSWSRDQLRGLLEEIPRFAMRETQARVARRFSNQDVLLIATFCRLETVYGLRRAAVARLSESIAVTLLVPRRVSASAMLVLDLVEGTCKYGEGAYELRDGMVFPLGPVFAQIEAFFAPSPLIQPDITFTSVSTSGQESKSPKNRTSATVEVTPVAQKGRAK